nr:hypothetical protein [Tanacetum cinerariifolium]
AQEEEIGRLKERVQVLEDREAVASKPFGEDAPIKGRSNNEGEAAAERISNDSEEIARVLTFMDASTVLAGETNVPTGSGFIPTAGPPATRRPMTKKQKREYYMVVIKSNLGWRFKDFKGMTFEEIEAKFAKVWKQVEDFIPIGSKEEAERQRKDDIFILENLSAEGASSLGKDCWEKMHKAFPLLGERSQWQYKFLLPVNVIPTAKRLEMPLPGVCTAIEEMMNKLPVKDRWQLH